MCNFYMMYWVDGDQLLENDVCASPGPPNYYFGHDQVYLFILFF
jgi:peptidylglycine monooxygenase